MLALYFTSLQNAQRLSTLIEFYNVLLLYAAMNFQMQYPFRKYLFFPNHPHPPAPEYIGLPRK